MEGEFHKIWFLILINMSLVLVWTKKYLFMSILLTNADFTQHKWLEKQPILILNKKVGDVALEHGALQLDWNSLR